jgi:pimeloyl-ACP methyl ester carboxylesterase
MVHGAISDHRIWHMQREAIAKSHRYVAFDQRYFGTGQWPDDGSQFSFGTHLDDLAAFIKELKVGPVDVVAWSYGASLALEVRSTPRQLTCRRLLEPSAGKARSEFRRRATRPSRSQLASC